MLDHVIHNNLFVIPADETQELYRYHDLFQAMLQDRLRRFCAHDDIDAIHRRVADLGTLNGANCTAPEEYLAVHAAEQAGHFDIAGEST